MCFQWDLWLFGFACTGAPYWSPYLLFRPRMRRKRPHPPPGRFPIGRVPGQLKIPTPSWHDSSDSSPDRSVLGFRRLHTNLLTVFAKNDNFQDYKNISYNGKFIFFAWGHKIDRHHTNIAVYASNIAQWAKKQNKEIGFVYDKVKDEDESFEYTRFYSPYNFGKLKLVVPEAIAQVFSNETIKPYRIQ